MAASDRLSGYQFKHEHVYRIRKNGAQPPDPYAVKPGFSVSAWRNGENVGNLCSVGGVTHRGEARVNVGVNPEHQGKGIGSRMFEIAEESNPSYTFVHNDLTRAGFGLVSSRKAAKPSRHEIGVNGPPPAGCTGHMMRNGGLQHDADTCPIHEA